MPRSEGRELTAGIQRAVSVGWPAEEPGVDVESYTWFHVEPVGGLDVVILSAEPVFYRGHYMAGAVQPCSVPRCAQCQAGIGVQVRCCLSVYSLNLAVRGLLEVGGKTGSQIHALSAAAGFLRGLAVHFGKEPQTARGHIKAVAYMGSLEVVNLPLEQDPLVPLEAQWAKQALRMRRKDGPANVQHRGEAGCSSTPKPGEAVLSSPVPQTIAEARAYIRQREAEKA